MSYMPVSQVEYNRLFKEISKYYRCLPTEDHYGVEFWLRYADGPGFEFTKEALRLMLEDMGGSYYADVYVQGAKHPFIFPVDNEGSKRPTLAPIDPAYGTPAQEDLEYDAHRHASAVLRDAFHASRVVAFVKRSCALDHFMYDPVEDKILIAGDDRKLFRYKERAVQKSFRGTKVSDKQRDR